MLTLINTNRMIPPIGPIGLDYVATSAVKTGLDVEIVDLCLADDPQKILEDHFANNNPQLVGLSFRNTDDCFWPGARWFIPDFAEIVNKIRNLTDAPIVVGGVGFSIFAQRVIEYTGVDFGIRGDGEKAIISLVNELQNSKRFEHVDGLIWRADGEIVSNRPSWPV